MLQECQYIGPPWCYLPHHAVLNPIKSEKPCISLDYVAKPYGWSLKNAFPCPDTTANVTGILLRFRKGRIAVSADVEEIFMQVKVLESNRGRFDFCGGHKV